MHLASVRGRQHSITAVSLKTPGGMAARSVRAGNVCERACIVIGFGQRSVAAS